MHYVLYFQVTLLEESWSELFLLCAIQWCLPFEKPSLFAVAGQFKCDSWDEVDTKRICNFKPLFLQLTQSTGFKRWFHQSPSRLFTTSLKCMLATRGSMSTQPSLPVWKPSSFSNQVSQTHFFRGRFPSIMIMSNYKIFFVVRFFPQFFQLSSDFMCFLLSNFLSAILYFLSFRHFRGRSRII